MEPMPLPLPLSRALRRSFDRSVHLLARAAHLHPAASPGRYGVTVELDVPYRDTGDRAHLLDVYRPHGPHRSRAEERPPAVLYVHGGGFSMLSKDTHRLMALSFAARGYCVFNINYRLGPQHTYPAPLEDAAAALLWMADHAAAYGADPERLVLAGESAGGNLVTALAFAASHPCPEPPFARALYERRLPIRAVLPIYGILDVHDLDRLLAHPRLTPWVKGEIISACESYLGPLPCSDHACAPLASPLRLLSEPPGEGARPLPPFFAAVGTADPVFDHSRRLKRALDARGSVCELAVYPGEMHGFNALLWRPAARAKWRAVFDFLARHA